jgi:hypothetical protein
MRLNMAARIRAYVVPVSPPNVHPTRMKRAVKSARKKYVLNWFITTFLLSDNLACP